MNKQYNELKEKIIEANKDIMKLKFGCKVLLKDAQDEVIIIGISYPLMLKKVENNDEPYYEVTSYNGFFSKNQFKIIGRPITIVDILKTRKDLAVDGLGGLFERASSNKEGTLWEFKFLGHCELNKPLQDQPEETIELLYNLICKK